jgi:uncharacterized protein (DUF2141 family)
MVSTALITAFFSFFFTPDLPVTISVTNLQRGSGDLYIGWYVQPAGFRVLEKATYKRVVAVTQQEKTSARFSVPAGTYAVAVFLDSNRNGQLDTNFFGAPTEPYGFSNNKLFALRPTSFEEAAFRVDAATEIEVRLK